jgi:uncharacterized protein YaaQ
VIAAEMWQRVSRAAFRYATRLESGAGSAQSGRDAELRGIEGDLVKALNTLVCESIAMRARMYSAPVSIRNSKLTTPFAGQTAGVREGYGASCRVSTLKAVRFDIRDERDRC